MHCEDTCCCLQQRIAHSLSRLLSAPCLPCGWLPLSPLSHLISFSSPRRRHLPLRQLPGQVAQLQPVAGTLRWPERPVSARALTASPALCPFQIAREPASLRRRLVARS